MTTLNVRLFGRLCAECDGQPLAGLSSSRVQELFCYLLLFGDRPHPREALAGNLWGDTPTAQSKKCLRQTLWQLHTCLEQEVGGVPLLLVEPDWIRLNPAADLRLDVAAFERAYARVQGLPGRSLDPSCVAALEEATASYQGDLLEGWYQEWCLFDRERLRNAYLAMLQKLMDRCEADGRFESGLSYGQRILTFDRAHERTHRRLMRLYYLSGDRSAALRQYDQCVEALRSELAVKPAESTLALYGQIRDGAIPPGLPPQQLLEPLRRLQGLLADAQRELQVQIQAMEASSPE
jgi:DNA-binding SARP family transcriptional activator